MMMLTWPELGTRYCLEAALAAHVGMNKVAQKPYRNLLCK